MNEMQSKALAGFSLLFGAVIGIHAVFYFTLGGTI